jgi:hypothetical protein
MKVNENKLKNNYIVIIKLLKRKLINKPELAGSVFNFFILKI